MGVFSLCNDRQGLLILLFPCMAFGIQWSPSNYDPINEVIPISVPNTACVWAFNPPNEATSPIKGAQIVEVPLYYINNHCLEKPGTDYVISVLFHC